MGLDQLRNIFGKANIPLDRQDVIELAGVFGHGRMVSFPSILQTGRVPQYDAISVGNAQFGNFTVDLTANDSYVRALTTIKENTLRGIQNSPQLQDLLQKQPWNREDRSLWERKVSYIVAEELSNIKGLDTYRTNSDPNIRRDTSLNHLAIDIDNPDRRRIEFDCEQMSLTQGMVLQQIDSQLLPLTAPQGDLRHASNYYFVSGNSSRLSDPDDVFGHAFIMSSATGNVIESTKRPNSYQEAANPNHSFERFVATGMMVTLDYAVYGGQFGVAEATTARNNEHRDNKVRRAQDNDSMAAPSP